MLQSIITVVEDEQRPHFPQELIRFSDTFDSSKDRKQEEEEIVQYYQYSADTGEPSAQVTMGTLHLHGGYGVQRNYEQAFRYFQQAAGQGDVGGIAYLGFMYANGYGIQQDNETAIKYYKEASKKV